MTEEAQSHKYRDELISVNSLEIDLRVQRHGFNARKVENIVRNYNEAAEGIITVSERNIVTRVIVDGWHRWEAKRRMTDNTGMIMARIFTGLTLADEAKMFLDLNPGNQPTALDRFKVSLVQESSESAHINKITRHYGWAVGPNAGPASLQCVRALERIYRIQTFEGEENLLQMTMLVVTRAWNNQRDAGSGSVLEGIAAVLHEYGSRVEVDRLIEQIAVYPGGPAGLLVDAQQTGRVRRMRTPMAIAELVVEAYNKGLRRGGPNELPQWRRR